MGFDQVGPADAGPGGDLFGEEPLVQGEVVLAGEDQGGGPTGAERGGALLVFEGGVVVADAGVQDAEHHLDVVVHEALGDGVFAGVDGVGDDAGPGVEGGECLLPELAEAVGVLFELFKGGLGLFALAGFKLGHGADGEQLGGAGRG